MIDKHNVILFPIQSATREEIDACDDISVTYWQGRLVFTKTLNQVSIGLVQWNDELEVAFHGFNRIAKEWGFPTLNHPLE